MNKSEMKEDVKNHFKGLLDVNDSSFDFDFESALYYLATNWHSGQWSELYSILSTSGYKPGRLENFESWKEENFAGSDIYDYLEDKYIS